MDPRLSRGRRFQRVTDSQKRAGEDSFAIASNKPVLPAVGFAKGCWVILLARSVTSSTLKTEKPMLASTIDPSAPHIPKSHPKYVREQVERDGTRDTTASKKP